MNGTTTPGQNDVSLQRGLPVEIVSTSSQPVSITGETVQMQFYNSGTLTNDAGEAIGTKVVAQLANNRVANGTASLIGTARDTSLSFTSTALTSEVFKEPSFFESFDRCSGAVRLNGILEGFANGEFTVDYRNGTIYGVKASVQSTLTSTAYKIRREVVSGSFTADTEFPAAAAASDNYANPTTTDLKSFGMLWDGAAWDRAPGNSAAGATVSLGTLIEGEDQTNHVMKVEQRFTSSGVLTGDSQVKAAGGFLHSVTFSCNDAAPTAGSIIIYNNTAESGTQVFNHTFTTTPFAPFTVTFDIEMGTGIYVGFTTTADVNVMLSFR